MKTNKISFLLFVLALFSLLVTTGRRVSAEASISISNSDETVTNQAVTANQTLTIFSGEITNTDSDSDATINFFDFQLNQDETGLDSVNDDIDTISVTFGASSDEIDVDGGDPLQVTLNESLDADAGAKEYTITMTMVDGPDHDDRFNVDFNNVTFTEDFTGTVRNEGNNTATPTNVITIKNLVESYASVTGEGIPRVLAAESDTIPLIHMEFAGQDDSSGTAGFHNLEFRIRELIGEFIPGGTTGDDYGDLESVSLVRSSQEEFGEGTREVLFTIDRHELPSDLADSFVINFNQASEWPPDEDAERFSETTNEAHYYITIETNKGWGVNDADPVDHSQFFGYGDAWDAWVDTDAIAITPTGGASDTVGNSAYGDTVVNVTQGPIYNGLRRVTSFTTFGDSTLVDKFGGSPVVNLNDENGLDYLAYPLVEFTALGTGSGSGKTTTLDEITLTFPYTSKNFTPKDDLKKLTSTKKSGLSLWFNQDGSSGYSHADRLIDISDEFSSWESDTVVKLVLDDGFTLPSPDETSEGLDSDLESNRGLLPENLQKNFYVSFLIRRTGNFPDSFAARVPLGGIQFSQGTSETDQDVPAFSPRFQPVPSVDTHTVTSGTQVAQPVTIFFSQLTGDSEQIGAPSDSVPLVGLNVRDFNDQGGTDAVLDQVHVMFERSDTETDFRATDLKDLADNGVSIYMDNNSSSLNVPGVFQPDVDVEVPINLPESGNTPESSKDEYSDGPEDNPVTFLQVDHTGSVTPEIPNGDSGDSEGADFFIVAQTSADAGNLDTFRAVLGNKTVDNGPNPRVQFAEQGNTSNKFASIFAFGDGAATDRFFGDFIEVNTITNQTINPLPDPGDDIDIGGRAKGLFGLNITDGSNGNQTLDDVTLTFNWETSTDSTVIKELTEGNNSGVTLWRDNGDGVFDEDSDINISLSNPSWRTFPGDTAQVNLTPDSPVSIPDDDSDGLDDFYIAATASENLELDDELSATIRGGDIQYSVETSPEDKSDTTEILTGGLPIILNNRVESPHESIKNRDDPVDVLGINVSDDGTDESFKELTVALMDVGSSNFSVSDLQALSGDSTSGVTVWRDNGDGSFSPSSDTILSPTNSLSFSGQEVTFDFRNSDSDTSIPDLLDNSDDFFVAVRVSETINHADDFAASIQSGDFVTTRFTNELSETSNPVVFGSANASDVTITDTDLISDDLTVEVTVANQDTVALGLATDEDVFDTPQTYETVDRSGPDQPGGSVFTFDDVTVSISADTIGVVARGFNDTGPTNFSDRDIFGRDSLVGIDLTGQGRPLGSDLSKADAMAADEEFGIAVFGDKGPTSSNDNSDDPAFDPSEGETLKIIPPVDSTVTLEVYNLEQELVFETSTSAPGQPAEWDGSSFNRTVVLNGVYIVQVRSGGEVKSFPVVVVQ